MNIAVLSDIHGNGIALRAVLEDMKGFNIDDIIVLGDIIADAPEPKFVLETLKELKPLVWIKGNTDEWFEQVDETWEPSSDREKILKGFIDYVLKQLDKEDLEFIKNLKNTAALQILGHNILCVHGSPKKIDGGILPRLSNESLMKELAGVNEKLILCGHTHQAFIMNFAGKTIINPGPLGIRDDIAGAHYGILTLEKDKLAYEQRRVEYDYEAAIKLGEDLKFPNFDEYTKFIIIL